MRRTSLVCLAVTIMTALPLPALARSISTIPGAKPVSRRTLLQKTYGRYAEIGERRAVRAGSTVLENLVRLDEFGVSFRFPKGWVGDTTAQKEGTVTLAAMVLGPVGPTGARPNMNIVFEDLTKAPLTLNQYTEEALRKEREFFSEMTITSRDRRTVAGYSADVVRFDAVFAGVALRYEQVWFLRGNQMIVWTFTDQQSTFDDNLKIFHAVLDSLEVTR